MRKFIITAIIAATALPTMASAQTGELRRDRQEVREQQRDVNRAIRNGASPREIREQRQDVREARRETREDWRDYRTKNRAVYRQGAYVGPRGYRYRPLVAGYQLAPTYFGARYLIADPYRYRLPAAVGPQRWVRYGNDVALVNIRTGRVISVNRDFFF